jgi:protein NrfD
MNFFVADPEWRWWIILYFFLGGIAAGTYFLSTLIDLTGNEKYHPLARTGYLIAFPLICLCGVFLTVDLERPERFWHMLLKSEIVHEARAEGWPSNAAAWKTFAHAFLFKYWSPMSIGAWALLIFGVCSFLSVVGSLRRGGWLERVFRVSFFGRMLQVVGCIVGFFVAAYTGVLLEATNQPLWSDSPWISSLFLASAASTGIATMILLVHDHASTSPDAVARLEFSDIWALILELIFFGVFLAALGPLLRPVLFTVHGKILVIGTAVLGIVLPLLLHTPVGRVVRGRAVTAALLALLGGFCLRYGILTTSPELLSKAPELQQRFADELRPTRRAHQEPPLIAGFSPEDGRRPGGGMGADPGNKPAKVIPRSKVFHAP